jgi:DNA invertase Pin-like site-specific DNA recombinase
LFPSPLIPTENNDNNDEEKKKLCAAAYCRVSSGSEEQKTSYVAQVDYYSKYLGGHSEYIFCGIYADEGITGTSVKRRPDFQRMLQDCRDGKLDLIIAKSVSRFGRNTLDCLVCIRELKSLGVDVYFEKENIHTLRSEGEVLLSLIAAVAQAESESLSSNVAWGIRRKYEKGHVQSIPSGKFLGYDKDAAGNLVINEDQAVIIRRIYQEFLDGYGYYTIASRLTAEGIPTEQNNKVWNWSAVKKMLTNEKYMGDTLCQKTYNADPLTKRRIKNRGELPQYYFEDTHPAIIERDTWHCVQLEFLRQEQFCEDHDIGKYHNSSEDYPMSARITCGTCGCTYVLLESKRIGEEGRKYWRCSSFHGKQGAVVEGMSFTPPPPHGGSTNPYMIKRRK